MDLQTDKLPIEICLANDRGDKKIGEMKGSAIRRSHRNCGLKLESFFEIVNKLAQYCG